MRSPIGCGESLSPSITPVVSNSIWMNINKQERHNYLHLPNSLSGSLSTFDVSSWLCDDEVSSLSACFVSFASVFGSEVCWLLRFGIVAPKLYINCFEILKKNRIIT